MDIKYIAINGYAKNSEDAIKMCGEALYKNGFVIEGFSKDCILREKEFPTGLPTDVPVAIPHCNCEKVLQDSICFLKLEEPVMFYRMDDDQECIMTDIVFNLAIKDSKRHVSMLGNLMKFITNRENIHLLKVK